jgi:hypothetical protein
MSLGRRHHREKRKMPAGIIGLVITIIIIVIVLKVLGLF